MNVDHENCIAPIRLILRSRVTKKPIESEAIVSLAFEKLAIAKEVQLEKERNGIDENSDIILLENVSRNAFIDWTIEKHYGLRPTFVPTGTNENDEPIGHIIVTEHASGAHEIAAGYVAISIRDQLSRISRRLENLVDPVFSKTIIWNNGVVKLSDSGLTFGTRNPNVVVEVAHVESLYTLRRNVHDWIVLTHHVQVSIGIKIFEESRRMIALSEDRNESNQEIEFGINTTPPPLRIPIALLYTEISKELQNVQFVSIDLTRMRTKILSRM